MVTHEATKPLTEQDITDRLLFINGLLVDLIVFPKVHRASEELTTLVSEIARLGILPEDPAKHSF